ncbi:MAG: hypothetical protein AAGK00_00785 [Pseudomonadota bacterium]
MPRMLAAAAFVIGLSMAPALADVTVSIGSDGYNDFFDRCDIALSHQGYDGDVGVIFRVIAGDKGRAICQSLDNSMTCRDSDDLEYTCEDISLIDVLDVSCARDGVMESCGPVSVTLGEGLSIPLTPFPGLGTATADVRVYGTVLGYDDFFEDCEMGFSYAGPPEVEVVEVRYDVNVPGGTASCVSSLSGAHGTGRSCSGGQEFQCDAVTSVVITEMTCSNDGNNIDCGEITFSTLDPLFSDGR